MKYFRYGFQRVDRPPQTDLSQTFSQSLKHNHGRPLPGAGLLCGRSQGAMRLFERNSKINAHPFRTGRIGRKAKSGSGVEPVMF
jgi:hypothetical protein